MAVTGAAARVQVQSQLVEHREGFEVELRRLGFTPASIVNQF